MTSAGLATGVLAVSVTPAPPASIALTRPITSQAAVATNLVITESNAAGNVASNFVGTVALTTDDPRATLQATKAGVAVTLLVSARGANGNVDTSFSGTVALAVDDANSNLPASIDIDAGDAGSRALLVVFGDLGLRTVSATRGALSANASTTVRAGAPHRLLLTVSGPAATGVAKTVHVAAVDPFDQFD